VSEARVRMLREAYRAFNEGHLVPPEYVSSDVELVQPDGLAGGEGVYRGRAGVLRGLEGMAETFADLELVVEELFDHDDHVVAFVRLRGRARASGVPIDAPVAHVVTFRGDLIARLEVLADRDEALRSVGLHASADRRAVP
jgi:ketosteroid isomerase-like protein